MIENPDFDINCDYASLCLFLPSWKLNARRDKVGDMIVQLEFDTSSHWPPSAPEHIHSLEFKLSQCWSKITRNPQNISLFHFNVFCLWQECRFFNSWNAFCLQSGENGFIDVLAEGENHASLINNNIDNIVG